MGFHITPRARRIALIVCVALQAVLLYLSASALGSHPGYLYGARFRFPVYPLVPLLAALVGIAIFVLPSIIGLLCMRWQAALPLAVLPWWLTVIAHAGAFLGLSFDGGPALDAAFWLDAARIVPMLLSLALFATLGALGWLAGLSLLAPAR